MPLPSGSQPSARVYTRARVTIGSVAYDTVSVPPGITDKCDPVLVTTLDSVYQLALPGCVVKTDAFEMSFLRTSGVTPPAARDTGNLVFSADISVNGGTPATESLTVPVTVTSVGPDVIEADGNRIDTWKVTLQPTNVGRTAGTED